MSPTIEPPSLTEHAVGSPGAAAQLILYGDYECPGSARTHFEIAMLARRFGQRVRYVFRHFPNAKLHPHALLAAQAAEAAASQGRFWAMHAMLLANHHAITNGSVSLYASTLGLDTHRFARELASGRHLPKVTGDLWSGARFGVTGTPTLFLNERKLGGIWDADHIDASVRALVDRPTRA